MATQSMETMLASIFLTPGKAMLEIEDGYRNIWAKCLSRYKGLLTDAEFAGKFDALVTMAPIMKVAGTVDIGLTMRIASMASANGKISLAAGPIGISGGLLKQTSEESVMTVNARFTLASAEIDLPSYLEKQGVPLKSLDDLDKAIKKLGEPAVN